MLNALRQSLAAWFSPTWPEVDADTALLWEPCSRSHGEIVPGYAQILLDLGYRVVVLMTPKRIGEGLFSRMTHPNLVLTDLTQRQSARFVKTPAVHQSGVFLVSTAGKLPHKADARVDIEAVFGANPPANLQFVEHDAKAEIDAGVWSERTITLREIDYKGHSSTVVNPHVFGDIKITGKNKDKTVFLLVGAARSRRRNQNLLYDAAERLVDSGVIDFEIRLIGKKGATTIPNKLIPYVVELGRVNFSDMYREVENADFIVTAFQRDNPDHASYKTVKTTGSFQLCYGFGKPCVLQQEFSVGTALTHENSLFYDHDGEMFDALQRAVNMSSNDYENMQAQLVSDVARLYDTSLSNMKKLIDG